VTATNPFGRWAQRFPERATIDAQTFAWDGYEGLCGWCSDELWAELEAVA
jgi:hypothetical protein